MKKKAATKPGKPESAPASMPEGPAHARILAVPKTGLYLDTLQLTRLEASFRDWSEESPREDVRLSRRRIRLIFLLIRYTGAKLNEVLALDPFRDIDPDRHVVVLGRGAGDPARSAREVEIAAALCAEIRGALAEPAFKDARGDLFKVDPGHVRRKFYERAAACGFPKASGAPDALRKSRAVELMQSGVPLPAVQRILGHSTPNLTTSLVAFSDDEIRSVTRHFMEKESRRKTSARNTFFGKIRAIRRGDIQTLVELTTLGGNPIATVITNDSLARLGLTEGRLITAEVKAPLVVLCKGDEAPETSADNRLAGTVERIIKGKLTAEYVVRVADGTELCSLVTAASSRRLALSVNDPVWAVFSSFAVVLHVD